jgi:hypothetical protein
MSASALDPALWKGHYSQREDAEEIGQAAGSAACAEAEATPRKKGPGASGEVAFVNLAGDRR